MLPQMKRRLTALVALVAVAVPLTVATNDIPDSWNPFSEDGVETQSMTLVCRKGVGSPAVQAMEIDAVPASCWYHIGHHHYFVGKQEPLRLWGGSGLVFIVEQNGFSPSTDSLGPAEADGSVGLVTEVPIQISMDGVTWTDVSVAEFRVVAVESSQDLNDLVPEAACDNTGACQYKEDQNQVSCISLPGGCHDTYWRQLVKVEFEADGDLFRFIRFHSPPSIYTGLSGFLDSSSVQIQVSSVAPPAAVPSMPREDVRLDCTSDIMERFYADHPCTFGGYVLQDTAAGPATHIVGNHPGQWDSPSFFHTYPLGDGALLDRIKGEVEVRDWRNNAPPATRGIHVQTSVDGEYWQTVHTFSVDRLPPQDLTVANGLGIPDYAGEFDVTLTDHEAKFVRLVAEVMPNWSTTAPNKHPWAFMQYSDIQLGGDMPADL